MGGLRADRFARGDHTAGDGPLHRTALTRRRPVSAVRRPRAGRTVAAGRPPAAAGRPVVWGR
ncbi:hypothetical protein ACFFX0_29295 [Citricoccus parietis]|uniref:Uncharacterized protein n=1 Tax=Citricoccus parietis TaxID=592307 RepID=A0ABV5G843_9MICC